MVTPPAARGSSGGEKGDPIKANTGPTKSSTDNDPAKADTDSGPTGSITKNQLPIMSREEALEHVINNYKGGTLEYANRAEEAFRQSGLTLEAFTKEPKELTSIFNSLTEQLLRTDFSTITRVPIHGRTIGKALHSEKLSGITLFSSKTAADKFYRGIGSGGTAAGVNTKYASGKQEIGISPDVTYKLKELQDKLQIGLVGSSRDLIGYYDAVSTVIHEVIHCWHVGAFEETPAQRSKALKINEGMVEWLSRYYTCRLMEADPKLKRQILDVVGEKRLRGHNGAYQGYVVIIEKLAKLIEHKGYDGPAVITQILRTGYTKDFTKVAELLGVSARKLTAAINKAVTGDPSSFRELEVQVIQS